MSKTEGNEANLNEAMTGDNVKDNKGMVLTKVRKSMAPYLPPPLLRIMHGLDAHIQLHHAPLATNYCYDEPSMAILSALFLAYMLWKSALGMWTSTTMRSTAHLIGEDNNTVLGGLTGIGGIVGGGDKRRGDHASPTFRETVVICGAKDSGKTSLLHRLCNMKEMDSDGSSWDPPMTVTSLTANAGFICPWEDITNGDNNGKIGGTMTIRIIDYPGHQSLLSQLTTLLIQGATARLIFVLDATEPVTEGAALLYQYILTHAQVRQSWSKAGKTLVILVVCTKCDVNGAKNYKRMKIQLRTELDRLRKVDMAISDGSKGTNGGANHVDDNTKILLHVMGKSVDLDNLGSDVPVSLHFVESGYGKDITAIHEFVLNGVLPSIK